MINIASTKNDTILVFCDMSLLFYVIKGVIMKIKSINLGFAVVSTLAVLTAQIAGAATEVAGAKGKINFTGAVVEGACNLSAGQKDQIVDFGEVGRSVLNEGGVATANFSIALTDCEPAVKVEGLENPTASAVEIRFNSGKVNAQDVKQLNNTAGAKNAQNVVVKVISTADGSAVNFNNETSNITQTLVGGDMTFPFEANVSSPDKNATTGAISTDTDFTIYYK